MEVPPPFSLLHEDLLICMALHLLVMHLPSALRLVQTCKAFHASLQPVIKVAEARRLRWISELTEYHTISGNGSTVTKHGPLGLAHPFSRPMSASRLLPTVGDSAWRVRVDKSAENLGGGGYYLGVCDAKVNNAWGLLLAHGRLLRFALDRGFGAPPPAGWPDGDMKQVMKDEAGRRTNLWGCAAGAVIDVIFRHDEGTLSYRVNDGALLPALCGFPRGASLRAWVSVDGHDGDRVSLVRPYL